MKLWPKKLSERLGWLLIVVVSLAFALSVAFFRVQPEPGCFEIHKELEPAPPAPRPAPKPREHRALMGAGELVAFWEAWEACDGEHCID